MPRDIVVLGPPGTGKCVHPDTLILTDDGLVAAGALCREWPAPDEAAPLRKGVYGLFGRQETSGFYNGGVKESRLLKTRRGYELIGTPQHPVWTLREGRPQWVKLGDVRIGDRVAIQSGLKVFPSHEPELPAVAEPLHWRRGVTKAVRAPGRMEPELAEWLGWFVSEGCNRPSNKYALLFSNYDPGVIDRMDFLTRKLFGIGLGWRGSRTDFSMDSSLLKKWLRSIGVDGLSSDKRVPPVVLRSTMESQRAYLRAAFEADGSATESRCAIEFSTASEKMAAEVQLMLLNFGIFSTRSAKLATTKRWGRRPYSRLLLSGVDAIAFVREIGFAEGSIKQGQVVRKPTNAWNLRGLPSDFVTARYREIREHMKAIGLEKGRAFWRCNKTVARALAGSRKDSSHQLVATSTVGRALEAFEEVKDCAGYRQLFEEANSGRMWDEVHCCVAGDPVQVVDLVVPEGHSFIGNGIICHNTESMITVSRNWLKTKACDRNEIAYLAFTKAAAGEAASRIIDEDLRRDVGDKMPYFRTLHSLAYRGMRKEKDDLRPLTTSDMKHFAQVSSMQGIYAVHEYEDLSEAYSLQENFGRTEWDKCLTAYTLSRISARNVNELAAASRKMCPAAEKMSGWIDEDQYRAFIRHYETYKKANGLLDFTDMLAFGLTEMQPLDDVKYVVIDEAQDLAPILFAIVDRLFRNAKEIWWAGDDDQCLYTFAAADARLFIDRARKAHTRIFLRDTHRFGIEIVNVAGQIIRQVKNRVPKEVVGVPGRGHVIHSTGEFKPIVAKMLLLHRHVMGCQALASTYFAAGLPFRNERGRDPLGASQRMKAFKAMRDLADGKEVTLGAIHRLVDDLMPSVLVDEEKGEKKRLVVHGAKKKLQDSGTGSANILDLMRMKILTEDGADLIRGKHFRSLKHADDLEYYDRVIDNGYSLETVDEQDQINVPVITTIHGAKGRQSPRVVVFNEMGRKCGEDDMDTEHRLAYVAATRTSGELEVCSERMVDWAEKMYEYPLKEK